MKSLSSLLHNLSNEERLLLHKQLKQSDRKSKKYKLLNLIIQKPSLNDNEAAILIYKSKPNSALSQLKKRLKQDIIDVILLNPSSTNNKGSYFKDKITCGKYLLISQQLIYRGLQQEAENYLKMALRLISERKLVFEKAIYNNIILELETHKSVCILNISDKIEDNNSLNNVFNEKLQYHLAKKTLNSNQSYINKNSPTLPKTNSSLNSDLSSIESSYYKEFNTILSNLKNNAFSVALIKAKYFVEFCNTNSKYLPITKQTKAYIQLAHIYILNGMHNEALLLCEKLDNIDSKNDSLFLERLTIQWQANFLTENLSICENMINKVIRHKEKDEKAHEYIIWFYFRLCLLFKQNNFKKLLTTLSYSYKFINNKSPMYLATRLFEIYSLVNLKKLSLVSSRILAFKQLLKRYECRNKSRYQYILRILQKLERSDFDLQHIYNLLITNQIQTELNYSKYCQDLFGYELVSVEEWIINSCLKEVPELI